MSFCGDDDADAIPLEDDVLSVKRHTYGHWIAVIRLLTEDNSDISSFICHADYSCFFPPAGK